MTAHLARVADLVLNRPLLIEPGKLAVIAAALDGRLGLDTSELPVPGTEASRFVGSRLDRQTGEPLAYQRTGDGVAIISLIGSFVNRGAYIGASSGLISYEGFAHQLRLAGADPKVRAVLLDMESPGGQATGAFETAKVVRDLAAVKPITAVVNGLAASAAYAIASQATKIITTQTGYVGSVGVVALHIDRSGALEKAGLKPTFIHAGARKVEGHPYAALGDDVRVRLQADIDGLMNLFVDCVATGRPSLTEKAIRATEAGCFMGAQAVAVGLADEVGTFDSALADLSRPSRSARRANGSTTLSTPRSRNVTEDDEKAVRADERARVKAITSAPEARGREKQALALATATALTLDEAVAIMAASPRQNADAMLFEASVAGNTPLDLDAEFTSKPGAQAGAADWGSLLCEMGFDKPGAPA